MKKLIVTLLLAVMMTGICATAFGITTGSYDAVIFGSMSKSQYTTSALVAQDMRELIAASFLLDYMLSIGDADVINEIDWSKSMRIAAYDSNHVDIYAPLVAGGYLNLFVNPYTGSNTAYRTSSFSGSSSKTYYTISGYQVLTTMGTVLEYLQSN